MFSTLMYLGSCLLQTEGTVEAVIALCSEYWAGKSIAKIDDNVMLYFLAAHA